MVARIREEGLQRSQLANTLSYMTDVLGARLTNSRWFSQSDPEWQILAAWVRGEERSCMSC